MVVVMAREAALLRAALSAAALAREAALLGEAMDRDEVLLRVAALLRAA